MNLLHTVRSAQELIRRAVTLFMSRVVVIVILFALPNLKSMLGVHIQCHRRNMTAFQYYSTILGQSTQVLVWGDSVLPEVHPPTARAPTECRLLRSIRIVTEAEARPKEASFRR